MLEQPIQPSAIRIPSPAEPLFGYKVILEPEMVIRTEDWSKVRSPGRARRRERYGHRQRIVRTSTPRQDVLSYEGRGLQPTLVMHPARWPDVVRAMAVRQDFVDRAKRLKLDPAMAIKVQKAWEEAGPGDVEILPAFGSKHTKYGDVSIGVSAHERGGR